MIYRLNMEKRNVTVKTQLMNLPYWNVLFGHILGMNLYELHENKIFFFFGPNTQF